MTETQIVPPLRTVTKAGLTAVVEYFRRHDPVDKFRGTVETNEYGAGREVLWGSSGIARDLPDDYNLTGDSEGFLELRKRYL